MCVNDITIEKQELHCYVLTQDGRTYTAISKYGEFFREINFTKKGDFFPNSMEKY